MRSSCSRAASASSSSTRRRRPSRSRSGGATERLRALLERAAEFYARVLWDSDAGAGAREYLASRGLGEEVCREFRLGYAPGAARLASRALQEGYTQEELLAVGLANRRGNDYFQRRIVFPLADARGRVRGFQARKLHDDDPLQAKYVNSPEGELFRKGDLLYGLDTARQAIAREDRAVVVEGNTDVIALRQAGFAPVVASMGTALTEAQLRELARLTKRLFLCFDADAAGQDATLRGMELAVAQGFDVKIVALQPGTDPADDPAAFERQLASPVSYPVHRVRLLHAKAPDRNAAFTAIETFLRAQPDSPEHLDARRLATDLLDLPPETQAALAPRTRSSAAGVISPRLLDAGQRLERSALAGVAAHESLLPDLEVLGPEHFDDELHRRARCAPARAGGRRRRRADRAARRAVRARRRGGDHARDGQPAPAAPARARAATGACRRRRRAPRRAPAGAREAPRRDPSFRVAAATMAAANPR